MSESYTITSIWRTDPSDGVIGSVSLEVVGGPKAYLRVWDGLDHIEWGWNVHKTARCVWPQSEQEAG